MSISIVIPVYNAAATLKRCIDSILQQSYHDYEIILVNDGSKDDSLAICQRYASKYPSIKVISQENKGVSIARNVGLRSAQGCWIAFVDADDCLDKDYLSTLLVHSGDMDWIIGGYTTDTGLQIVPVEDAYNGDIKRFWEGHFQRLYCTVPWGKLYRRDIISNNGLAFNKDIRLGEDLVFNLTYLKHCTNIMVVSSSDYIYTTASPSSERYNLTLDELCYTISQIKEGATELSVRNGGVFNCDRAVSVVLGCYPLSKSIKNDAEAYRRLYFSCFPGTNETDFYNDVICSPILRALRLAKYHVKHYNIKDAFNVLNLVGKNLKKDFKYLNKLSRQDHWLTMLVKCLS